MEWTIGKNVPWNATWSGEDRCEIRPCKYAGGRLAVWSPFKPGLGKPLFAKPHMVRQRAAIAESRCTVCGGITSKSDRWWFPFGDWHGDWWVSTESAVHKSCAAIATAACPAIKRQSLKPIPFPGGETKLFAMVGGDQTDLDFGIKTRGRHIVGHLKLAWRNPFFLDPTWAHPATGPTFDISK